MSGPGFGSSLLFSPGTGLITPHPKSRYFHHLKVVGYLDYCSYYVTMIRTQKVATHAPGLMKGKTCMTIEEYKEGDSLVLALNGKIDVNSSDELTNVILRSFQKTDSLVLDMKDVIYVSSAGLRAFILGQRTAASKGSGFSLINVRDEIKAIFHTTGFDKLLKYS